MDSNNMTEEEALKIIESGLSQHMNTESLIFALCIVMANVVRRLKVIETSKGGSALSDLEKLTGKK
jgi:hypothetical protein